MQLDQMVPLLNVEDVGRSIWFYTEMLPFRVIQQYEVEGTPSRALLACGPIRLMINRPDSADSSARRQRPSHGDAVLYLYVADVRDCHAELSARGCAVSDVRVETYGMEAFTLRDPDGYELAIGRRLTQIA